MFGCPFVSIRLNLLFFLVTYTGDSTLFESFHFDYLKSQNLRSGELINNRRENFVDVCFSHQDRFFIVVDWFQWIDSMDDANDYLQFSNDSEMAFQNNQCYSIILRPLCE